MLTITPISNLSGYQAYIRDAARNRVSEVEGNGDGFGGSLLRQADGQIFKDALTRLRELADRSVQDTDTYAKAYDLTFSAPKSASLEGLVLANQDMLDAHHTAIERTMWALEQRLGTKLAWESHEHHTARGVDGQTPDPQLHSHVFVVNRGVKQAEGLLGEQHEGALDRNTIISGDLVKSMGMAYRHALADELGKHGYKVDVREQGEYVELSGYTDAWLNAFSKRSEKVKDFARDTFGTEDTDALSHKQRSMASKSTRANKDVGLDGVMGSWQKAVESLREQGKTSGAVKLDDFGYINDRTLNTDKSYYALSRIPHILNSEGAVSMDALVKKVLQDDLVRNGGTVHAEPAAIWNRIKDMADGGQLLVSEDGKQVTTAERAVLDTLDARLVEKMGGRYQVYGSGDVHSTSRHLWGLMSKGVEVVHITSDADVDRIVGDKAPRIDLAKNLASDFSYGRVVQGLTQRQMAQYDRLLNDASLSRGAARKLANEYVRGLVGKEGRRTHHVKNMASREGEYWAGFAKNAAGMLGGRGSYATSRMLARRGSYAAAVGTFTASLAARATGVLLAGVGMAAFTVLDAFQSMARQAISDEVEKRARSKDLSAVQKKPVVYVVNGPVSASAQSKLLSFVNKGKAEIHVARDRNRFGDMVRDDERTATHDRLSDKMVERSVVQQPGKMPWFDAVRNEPGLNRAVNEKIGQKLTKTMPTVSVGQQSFVLNAPVKATFRNGQTLTGTVSGAKKGELRVKTSSGREVSVIPQRDTVEYAFQNKSRGDPFKTHGNILVNSRGDAFVNEGPSKPASLTKDERAEVKSVSRPQSVHDLDSNLQNQIKEKVQAKAGRVGIGRILDTERRDTVEYQHVQRTGTPDTRHQDASTDLKEKLQERIQARNTAPGQRQQTSKSTQQNNSGWER